MLFNLLTFTVLIIIYSFPCQLFLYLETGELLFYHSHSCSALSLSSGAIIRASGWSLSSRHTPGQSRLSSPCSATIVNSLLFYTIDLLPPSPNIQVFVELLSCSTTGLSALVLLPINCQMDDEKTKTLGTRNGTTLTKTCAICRYCTFTVPLIILWCMLCVV